MIWFWLSLISVFLIIEAVTAGLISIWFAAGSAAAAIVTLLAPDMVWLQSLVFILVSVAVLLAASPLAKKVRKKTKPTNADMHIGKYALVVSGIGPHQPGAVKVNGLLWTAVSAEGDSIAEGDIVVIKEISGVKMSVSKV